MQFYSTSQLFDLLEIMDERRYLFIEGDSQDSISNRTDVENDFTAIDLDVAASKPKTSFERELRKAEKGLKFDPDEPTGDSLRQRPGSTKKLPKRSKRRTISKQEKARKTEKLIDAARGLVSGDAAQVASVASGLSDDDFEMQSDVELQSEQNNTPSESGSDQTIRASTNSDQASTNNDQASTISSVVQQPSSDEQQSVVQPSSASSDDQATIETTEIEPSEVKNEQEVLERITTDQLNAFLRFILQRKTELCSERKNFVNSENANRKLAELLQTDTNLANKIIYITNRGNKLAIQYVYQILTNPKQFKKIDGDLMEMIFRSVELMIDYQKELIENQTLLKPYIRAPNVANEMIRIEEENRRRIEEKDEELRNLRQQMAESASNELATRIAAKDIEIRTLKNKNEELNDANRTFAANQTSLKLKLQELSTEMEKCSPSYVNSLQNEIQELRKRPSNDEVTALRTSLSDKDHEMHRLAIHVNQLTMEIKEHERNLITLEQVQFENESLKKQNENLRRLHTTIQNRWMKKKGLR